MGLNKCMFIGRLGADPEMRTTPNGAQVCNFRIAVTERWKDKDGSKQEKTEWVTCVAWRKQAEIAGKYLRKGSQVYVEGKFQTRSFEDKNGGGKRYTTEIEVSEFQMLDARPSDCIALACQHRAPIYVSKAVWDEVEDMSDVLRKLGDQKDSDEGTEDEEEEES